jgi:subtilisin family serine protease
MRRFLGPILWIASLGWVAPATAQLVPQVRVPGVQVPALPVDPALRGVGEGLRSLPSRAVRSQRLFEQNRNELERDPRGDLVVRAEVVAIDITDPALKHAVEDGFLVKRTQELPDLGVKVTILQTPEGWSARRGLKRLRKLDPEGTYDFNHVYFDSGALYGAASTPATGADEPAAGAARVRIGVIDGGVDGAHISLRESVVHRFGCGGEFVPSEHGTAVGSLLAGSAANFHGAAPRAELFAADVYCGKPTGGSVDSVAAAFGWMARERVAVVNVSLVGPRNALLERVVKSLVDRGYLIVAAVGNDGPASPPLFPAAYDGVLGVTAVDGKHKVLLEACRGKHLDLAAPGTDFSAAAQADPDQYVAVRGTSFAAPLVAGLLARELSVPEIASRERAIAALTARAEDLGARGRDDTYGAGLVGADLPVSPLTPNK